MTPAVYRMLGLRYVLHRAGRATLIVASIALGVATLVSARILNHCLEVAAQDTTTPIGRADLYITNGEAGVFRSLVDEIERAHVPGVRAVQPTVYDRVTLPQLDGRIAVLIGVEVSSRLLKEDSDLKVRVTPTGEGPLLSLLPVWAAIHAGDFMRAEALWERIPDRLVVVTKPIFDAWKQAGNSGKPLILRYATRDVECVPVGVVEFEPDSPLAALGGNFVGMEVGQAARVLHPIAPLAALAGAAATAAESVQVDRIDLFLEPKIDRDQVAAEVERILAGRSKVQTPEDQRRATDEIISGLQTGFLACSAGAMIVGLFLVYNALAVTVAERRTDIGILRSIGATRGQVVGLFAAAAAVLGLVGAVAGVPLGVLFADFAVSRFASELQSLFLNPEVDPVRITWGGAGIAVLAGVGTSVFAALVPALQAASDDPADVVRRSAGGTQGVWRFVHRFACLVLIGGGIAAILLRHELPHRVGAFGGMMVALIGLLLSAPIVVGVFVSLVRPVIRATCGVTGRLAFDNLSRAPGRTGIVIGALGAGVAMMFQTAGVGRSNEEPVLAWVDQVVQADYFVLAGNLTSASSSNSPIAPSVVRDLRALPEVDRVMGIRYTRPEFNGTVVYVVALDAADYAKATRARVPDGMPDLERFLALPNTNDILVSQNFTRRHGVQVGDTIHLPGPNGPVALRIVGTVRDYSWNRGTIFMDRARYTELFGDDLIDICHVFMKPAEVGTPTGRRAVEGYASAHGLFVTDKDSLRQFVTELISRLYLLAYLQQIIVGVVVALGVVTALLISVLQRKRELGLLLAVGATPGQVLRSVLAEAVLMGVFGTALGILIGLPMEWYILRVIVLEESGFVFDVVVPWRETLGIAAAAIGTAALAGLLPALHAVRTRIPDAIQWE